jgi:uncharacterized metal-binding protein YceD (DUF177 family)
MTPEFPRPHRLDQIGAGEHRVDVAAEPEERAALARRFGLKAVDKLEASYAIRRDATGVIARGHLSGQVTQSCVVTDEPVPATIEEDFAIRFLPEADGPEAADDEFELSEDECDTVFYSGSAIDLGEAAAETLALALDPFPRSPDAAAVLKEAGVLSEDEAGPFGALAALKDKLAKKP